MTEFSVEFADWSKDRQALIDIRTRVFVHEQQVPIDLEIDDMDSKCLHLKALKADQEVIGTARLLPSNYIGRMCVLKEYRGLGVGRSILAFIIQHAQRREINQLMLNAQLSALPFYQRFGFEADSEIFMEAGIKHKHMTLILAK